MNFPLDGLELTLAKSGTSLVGVGLMRPLIFPSIESQDPLKKPLRLATVLTHFDYGSGYA
jgi:hypothetical protein